jgi:hypothetical protein
MKRKEAVFGTLSLFALGIGIIVGVASTMEIAAGAEEMASLGALAGLGIGLMACVPGLLLGIIGVLRNEKPLWPAALGVILSALPGGFGLYMIVKILSDYMKRL